MKKTLILGAAGFIGTNLTKRLLNNQKELVLFDVSRDFFRKEIIEAEGNGRVTIQTGSFAEIGQEEWKQRLPWDEIDTVYHLISTTCPTNSNKDASKEIQDNVISTIQFLDASVASGNPKVIFLSSGGTVYGKEHSGVCVETMNACPITFYGMQKLCIEKILYLYRELYGTDYRIVRLSNPYGPYQKPNGIQGAVTTFTYQAIQDETIHVYGDGKVVRDYIYIEDAISGILQIAEYEGETKLFNLGSGIGTDINTVIQTIEEVVGHKIRVEYQEGRPVDVPVNILDVSRYEETFGKMNARGLKRGIKELVDFINGEKLNGR